MAKIDDLVAQIADPKLRAELEKSVKELKKNTRFGLVFEDHIPEMSALVGLPLTVGELAMRRDAPSGRAARTVKAIHSDGTVTLEDKEGNTTTEPASDWLAAKQFGQPIYPGLEKVGEVKRGGADRPHHAVINAENYHAAQLLLYLYEGQVDCIYLDPPYNTGAKDWTYNNDYVDSSDAWRHSKWLSFMEKRLKLAKKRLKPTGIVVLTIDDYEYHHLKMLSEQAYLGFKILGTAIIKTSPSGRPTMRGFRVNHEYAIFMSASEEANIQPVDKSEAQMSLFNEEDEDGKFSWANFRKRGGANTHRVARPRQYYPIYVDDKDNIRFPKMEWEKRRRIWVIDDKATENEKEIFPIGDDGRERIWSFGYETALENLADFKIKRDGENISILRKVRLNDTKSLPSTWWDDPSYSIVEWGTGILNKIFGNSPFPFAKSINAVCDCLKVAGANNENAIIVDLFGGSGTTFHATCLLNSEDGGSRRCILVSNNEVSEDAQKPLNEMGFWRGDAEFEAEGIFEKVTRRRCEAVVTGLRPDGTPIPGAHIGGRAFSDGFEENVSFFKLNYLDPDLVDIGTQFAAIAPALWLAAGAVGECETQESAAGFLIPQGAKYGVLFDEKRLPAFVAALQARPDVTHAFLVTDSNEAYAEMKPELPHTITNMQMLYRDYLRSFRIQ